MLNLTQYWLSYGPEKVQNLNLKNAQNESSLLNLPLRKSPILKDEGLYFEIKIWICCQSHGFLTWIAIDPWLWKKTLNWMMLYSYCTLCTVHYIALVHFSTAQLGQTLAQHLLKDLGSLSSLSPQTKMERLGHCQLWEEMGTLPGHQTKFLDVLKSTQEGLAELKSKSLAVSTEFPSALSSLSPQSKMERSRQI